MFGRPMNPHPSRVIDVHPPHSYMCNVSISMFRSVVIYIILSHTLASGVVASYNGLKSYVEFLHSHSHKPDQTNMIQLCDWCVLSTSLGECS